MNKLLNYDNKLFTILNKLCHLVFLGLLWFVCSIPIVTIGASTTALYYTINKTIFHNRGYVFNEFWHSFKSNFKQSTIVWMLMIVFYLLAILDFIIFFQLSTPGTHRWFLLILLVLMVLLPSVLGCIAFPYIARFEDSLKTVLKNSIAIALMHLGRTILLVLLFTIMILVGLGFLPILPLIPSCFMCIQVWSIEQVFRKLIPDDLNKQSPIDLSAMDEKGTDL